MSLSNKKTNPSNSWLLTFADLVSLLITFFVMLFAMKSIDGQRWQDVTGALSGALSFDINNRKVSDDTIEKIDIVMADSLAYLDALLRQRFKKDPILKDTELVFDNVSDKLTIIMPSHLLFDVGSDILIKEGEEAVGRLGDLLQHLDNSIMVVGHTDPTPIRGGVFDTNWELSMMRAIGVLEKLRTTGVIATMQAQGLADSRFDMLDSDIPVSLRYIKARRVEVVIAGKINSRKLP